MKRIGLIMALCGMVAAVLSGCWNRRELNDLGIQMATAIDKVDGQYHLSAQVVVPSEVTKKSSTGTSAPVTMYKATAPTLFTAFRKLTEISPRKIYGAHIRVLVLGESLAKEGIAEAIDLLVRDQEVRSDFYVMIARDTPAENVLKVLTVLEKIPANNLFHSLDVSAKAWAPTTTVTLDQLIEKLISEGINPVLTGIRVIGDPNIGNDMQSVKRIDPAALLRFSGLAVMRKDRLVGWLNEEESKGVNYITNEVKSTAGYVKCPSGGLITLETIRSTTNMKGKIENGKPVVELHIVDESNIAEASCPIEIEDPEVVRKLEDEQRAKKIRLMKKAVEVVKRKYKVDIFGFGQAIYRTDPRAWSKLRNDWTNHFDDLEVRYDVQTYIRKTGKMKSSLKSKVKE